MTEARLTDEDARWLLDAAERHVAARYRLRGNADEAVSHVIHYVLWYAGTYRPDRGLPRRGWLRYLVRKGLLNYFSSRHNCRWWAVMSLDTPMGDGEVTVADACGKPDRGLDRVDDLDLIRRLTRRVKVRHRKMLFMEAAGMTLVEIGRAVSLPVAWVCKILKRVKRHMRRVYLRLDDGAGRGPASGPRRHQVERRKLVRAAAKGRNVYARERRKERELVGWPHLPAAQGKALAFLATVPHSSTPEIAEACGVKISTCRNALAALKRDGRVERCGGGGLGGDALYRITAKALAERG